ncbi:MAG: aspartate/glutamate racemase family protein [Tagaea sp.]
MARVLGILGGMGPAATADFFAKVVAATAAPCDQAHVRAIVWSDPSVPDRTRALAAGAASPLPRMRRGLAALEAAGADVIAVACNTAHRWHGELAAAARVPVLHIAEAAARELARRRRPPGAVAILATEGTLRAGFYGPILAARGLRAVAPADAVRSRVVRAIALAKAGRLAEGTAALRGALAALGRAGVDTALLACTELPLLAPEGECDGVGVVDAGAALARAAVVECGGRVRRARADRG